MPDTLNCPNCGAPLDYKGNDPIIRCPFCSSSVVVPDNLRSQPAFSSQPHNFTIAGSGDLGALINQAKRFKEVRDLALAGNMNEAMRVYSEITGADPDTARSSVEALTRGMPVKLSNMSFNIQSTNFNQNIPLNPPLGSVPERNYDPVIINDKTGNGLRAIGCGIGFFTVCIVILVLVVTLVPTAAGLAGMYVGFNPDIVLTMLPAFSTTISTPEAALPTEVADTPLPRKTPTKVPTATAAFASSILTFGKQGTDPGSFVDVRSITVEPGSGIIYTADYSDGRIQAFDNQGKFITQWTVQSNPHLILGMAADQKGNVYAAVSGSILIYNAQGKLQATLKPASLNDHYEDVAILQDGSLMVVSRGENVLHLSTTGKILNRFDKAISNITKRPELSSKIAVDGDGNIYLLGAFNNAVFVFNSKGNLINQFGSEGDAAGKFRAPMAVAVDQNGRIYVSDVKGVQVFSNDGAYINVLKVMGVAFGLAFDDQGSLYLTSNQQGIVEFQIP